MFSINNWHDRLFKIISIIGFFLIIVVLAVILRAGPALSYEFSIYDAYPWYFWVLLLSAIFCGQMVILGSAIIHSKKNYWFFGLCLILVANAVLLFMTLIRGYYINSDGDVLTHIGYMKDIIQTSSIGGNYYPIDHILGVIIYLFSGISFPYISQIIPPFFSFFFILSIYLVGKTIFPDKFAQLILIILSSVLMLGISEIEFTPNAQAFFLIPLVFYCAFKMYSKANNKEYYILLLLTSFLIVFYHPLVTVMVILILCLMQIMQYILEKYENRTLKKVNYIYTILFIVIVFSMWSTYLNLATQMMEPIVGRIFGQEITQSELQKNVAIATQVNLDPMYLLKLIFSIYGQWVLTGILSLFCIGLILKLVKDQKIKLDFYIGILVLGFIIFSMLSILMLIINGSFGFGRIYAFACLFSLLLIPTGFYLFLYDNSNGRSFIITKIIKLFIIIFIFFGITYFSTFNLYYSPIIKNPNLQVPKSEYIGMSTFLSNRNVSLPILEYVPSSYRYYDAIYGHSAKKVNIGMYDSFPPEHFGYQNETLSLNFYNNTRYLLVDDRGRGLYPNVFPEFKYRWRFLDKDFERLTLDNKIQKVYSNRNLDIFVVS